MLFPLIWDHCTAEKQQRLLDDVIYFLSQDFHKAQKSYFYSFILSADPFSRSSNSIQVFLEGLTRCKSLPLLPASLSQSIAVTFDPFHMSYLQEEAWKEKECSLAEWRDLLVVPFGWNEK